MNAGILLLFRCRACEREWTETAWRPEDWEGERRTCPWPGCEHVGLDVMEVPKGWVPTLEED